MAHEQGPSVCVGRGGERYIWGGFLLFRGVWYTMLGGGGGENDHGLFLEGICVKRLSCVLLFFVLLCSCALGQGDAGRSNCGNRSFPCRKSWPPASRAIYAMSAIASARYWGKTA